MILYEILTNCYAYEPPTQVPLLILEPIVTFDLYIACTLNKDTINFQLWGNSQVVNLCLLYEV